MVAILEKELSKSVDYFKHESAYIDKDVSIGSGTKVWHFSHIMSGAAIGSNVVIGQNCFIGSHVIIGNGCKIQNNVSIYTGVTLEEEVFIGPSVVFTNVIRPRAFIEQKNNFKSTRIKKGATIGANVTVICGSTIGQYALVGAGSVVTRDVTDHELCFGSPLAFKYYVDQSGKKLDFSNQQYIFDEKGQIKYSLEDSNLKIEPVEP